MDNIIYLINNINSDKLNINGKKIGSTINLVSRMKTYQTIFADLVPLECYYVINKNCYEVDEMLKEEFNEFRLITSGAQGGTEIYDADVITQNIIEHFFVHNNIKFAKYYLNDYLIQKILKPINNIDLDNIKIDINETRKDKRTRLQDIYMYETVVNLTEYNRCLVSAPTGFGKTHIIFKVMYELKPKRVLILTPRKLLNLQILDIKYTKYISELNYKNKHFSELSVYNKEQFFKTFNKNENLIITSCYQSGKKLSELILKYNISFDLVIFDEAHIISEWKESLNDKYKDFFLQNDLLKKRLFTTATPTEDMIVAQNIFGKIVEKVKVYELINSKILCNIETIVKQLDNTIKQYSDLSYLIIEAMEKYNKKKGIIYVNNRANAKSLYNLMKNKSLKTYIYVSDDKDIKQINDNDKDLKQFENNNDPCIIIAVGKIGYGYDNDLIDFICFGDSRQSAIDIRQIIGRGLRWNKSIYPNKLLHVLVPLYKDEFNSYKNNEHLKKYFDYIIGECGKDIIIKNDNKIVLSNGKNLSGISYNGDIIPTEILQDYCTTNYNMWTQFRNFIKVNECYNETTYNILRETQDWMPLFSQLRKKYPNFCFRDIHPNSLKYYWNKYEAKQHYNYCLEKLTTLYGKDKIKKYNCSKKLELVHEMDNKIPLCDFEYYYPYDKID